MIPASKLSTIGIFRHTSESALTRLAAAMESRSFRAGDEICHEGESGRALFLIASGSADVMKKIDSAGAQKKVARLGHEDFFGEMAFLEEAPYSATVVAQEETEILILPRLEMDKLMKQEPSVALDQVLTLFSGLSGKLRQTTSELVALFEVARIIGLNPSVEELSRQVIKLIQPLLGNEVSFAFYLWNLFNDEYTLIWTDGNNWKSFPIALDGKHQLLSRLPDGIHSFPDISREPALNNLVRTDHGHAVLSLITHLGQKEGLLVCYAEENGFFNREKLQLVETTTAVLAPALTNIRVKEEEKAKILYERSRDQ